jgi:quercetin dioxygenase-like cupin family protein
MKRGFQMTFPYKIDFAQMDWETPMAGVRHKYIDQDGKRLRFVEYSKELPPHWCEKGHCGYLISGKLEIEFSDTKIAYNPGDCIYIPDGAEHRHMGKVISNKATVFFIEKA